MPRPFAQSLRSLLLLVSVATSPIVHAEPIPVRYQQGAVRGFLELRDENGHIVASGDFIQDIHGDRVTTETVFHFRDGSVDDETAVFTQHGVFRLISDRHIQKGPSFPHPLDVLVEAGSGQVTVRSVDKSGKEKVETSHLNLPPDLANGIVSTLVQNLRSTDPERIVSMVVATPKPILVKLHITPIGEERASVAGLPRKALHFESRSIWAASSPSSRPSSANNHPTSKSGP